MFVRFPDIERVELLSDETKQLLNTADLVIVSEKVDGSNVVVWLPTDKTSPIEFYTRNGNRLVNHGDFDSIKQQTVRDCTKIRNYLNLENSGADIAGYLLYGELFGRRVINRLPYDENTQIVFYRLVTVSKDGSKTVVFRDKLNNVLVNTSLSRYQIKEFSRFSFGIFDNKACLLDIDNLLERLPMPFTSAYTTEPANGEGYVLDFYLHTQWLGCLKYKDEAFTDKKCTSNILPEDIATAKQIAKLFEQYALNENRIIDMYSKGITKLSDLVPAVIQDAKQDFIKAHEIPCEIKQNKQLYKTCFNVGSKLFIMTKKVLRDRFAVDY